MNTVISWARGALGTFSCNSRWRILSLGIFDSGLADFHVFCSLSASWHLLLCGCGVFDDHLHHLLHVDFCRGLEKSQSRWKPAKDFDYSMVVFLFLAFGMVVYLRGGGGSNRLKVSSVLVFICSATYWWLFFCLVQESEWIHNNGEWFRNDVSLYMFSGFAACFYLIKRHAEEPILTKTFANWLFIFSHY